MRKIEVEVENLEMVEEALAAGADIIMLDNMSMEEMGRPWWRIAGCTQTECSGNVTWRSSGRWPIWVWGLCLLRRADPFRPILDLSLKHLRPLEAK